MAWTSVHVLANKVCDMSDGDSVQFPAIPAIPEDGFDADDAEHNCVSTNWIVRKTFLELESKDKDVHKNRERSRSDTWLAYSAPSSTCSTRVPSTERGFMANTKSVRFAEAAEVRRQRAASIDCSPRSTDETEQCYGKVSSIVTDYSPTYCKPVDEDWDFVSLRSRLDTDDLRLALQGCAHTNCDMTQSTITASPMLPATAVPVMHFDQSRLQYPMQVTSSAMIQGFSMFSNPNGLDFAMPPESHNGMMIKGEGPKLDQMVSGLLNKLDQVSVVSDSSSPTASTMSPEDIDLKARASRLAEKETLHKLNQCTPCFYFAFRADGCWKGEDCEFCHLCDKKQCRKREKVRAKALKKSKLVNCV